MEKRKENYWEEFFRKEYKKDWLSQLLNNFTFGYAEDLHVFTCICFNCRKYCGNCTCDLTNINKEVKQKD